MKKAILLCFMVLIVIAQLLVMHGNAYSVTANPSPIQFTQPDGTRLTIYLKGDEFIHWAETSDGFTIMSNSLGTYEYAKTDNYGRLVFSGIKANDPGKRTTSEVSFLNNTAKGYNGNAKPGYDSGKFLQYHNHIHPGEFQ
ncbi:MAG: hypothetical protein NT004_06005 [Bacteroidetes bacterium]|nr:hypothetical protein [Bacteroidota bacterium]